MSDKLRIGITLGDYNGIGPELILKCLGNEAILNYCTPVVYANLYVFKFYSQLLDCPNLQFNIVKQASDIKEDQVNLRICSNEKINIEPGIASLQAGQFAIDSLQQAVADIKNGLVHTILTSPINKHTIAESGFKFSGHTEYFAKEFDADVLMILLDDELRVAMVTGHTPLDKVVAQLTSDKIYNSIIKFEHSLRSDFQITKPKLAVLGLNPHSGDGGLLGNQESTIILPAIKRAQESEILCYGPYPPDGFFGTNNSQRFDGVLGMYHDQVLIPFKLKAFSEGVNFTAGLPMVRTSPDHGTAYDIAGKNIADTSSFVNALFLIKKLHRNRLSFFDSSNPPLPFKEHRREKFSIGIPDLN